MTSRGLKLLHANPRSIFRKVKLLAKLPSDVDFLCCSETWLDGCIADNLVQNRGYENYLLCL